MERSQLMTALEHFLYERYLEGYLPAALTWCDEMGARLFEEVEPAPSNPLRSGMTQGARTNLQSSRKSMGGHSRGGGSKLVGIERGFRDLKDCQSVFLRCQWSVCTPIKLFHAN